MRVHMQAYSYVFGYTSVEKKRPEVNLWCWSSGTIVHFVILKTQVLSLGLLDLPRLGDWGSIGICLAPFSRAGDAKDQT